MGGKPLRADEARVITKISDGAPEDYLMEFSNYPKVFGR